MTVLSEIEAGIAGQRSFRADSDTEDDEIRFHGVAGSEAACERRAVFKSSDTVTEHEIDLMFVKFVLEQ